jgi:hypothetical protein
MRKRRLERFGYDHEWTFDETMALLANPSRIPYLGAFKTASNPKPTRPQNIMFLTHYNAESLAVVTSYYAMLKMIEESRNEIEVSTSAEFSNLGFRPTRNNLYDRFLRIDAEAHGHSETVEFQFTSKYNGPAYIAKWWGDEMRLTNLAKRMKSFRVDNC